MHRDTESRYALHRSVKVAVTLSLILIIMFKINRESDLEVDAIYIQSWVIFEIFFDRA